MNPQHPDNNIEEIRAVGLFAFSPETGRYERRGSVHLSEDGAMHFDGPAELIDRLRNQAICVYGEMRIPDDGPAYLMALVQRFTTPYLKALPLRSS